MPSTITNDEGRAFIQRLSFPPQVEAAFQEDYYSRMRPTLRASLFLLVGLSTFQALLQAADSGFLALSSLAPFGVVVLNLLLLAFAFRPQFARVWQPLLIASLIASVAVTLTAANGHDTPFAVMYGLFVACRVQRLQLRWMAGELLALLALVAWANMPSSGAQSGQLAGTLLLSLLLMSVPLFFTFKSERFERGEFWTKHVLARERNDERRKREETERMLHVLSQAIGGIVHDLGNPLTSVQTGAETLLLYVREGEPDKEVLEEFVEIITRGAQMLNFLRLSLMEQTRVLEGKPVPVELKPASIRSIVKAGVQYQKPIFAGGRTVSIEGDDLEVCVDEMRFITVFMNLIGNALKYSDGEVRITWRSYGDRVLIAILDQGQKSQGISQAQAQELFVAFGRLDAHAKVEGTGLGLLSVRKIVEAHGGEVYIEGSASLSTSSAAFSTAQGTYPSMLEEGFCTAFVTACPQEVMAQMNKEELPILQDAFSSSHQ